MIRLVIGGNKSGKSTYAEKLAKESGKKVYYIATSVFKDEEMEKKIKLHQERRPDEWETIEEGYDLTKIMKNIDRNSCYLVDCITVYLSNILTRNNNENNNYFINHIKKIISAMNKSSAEYIIVSNEVGCGIISLTAIGRRFAEVSGVVNQILAEASKEVFLLTAGIPIKIKGE